MKRIIIFFIIILGMNYAIADDVKIYRLTQMLEKVKKGRIEIQNNKDTYNQLISRYKKISLRYNKLIKICKKDDCKSEIEILNKNFKRLNKSIKDLGYMLETDFSSIRSLDKQEKAIKSLIKLEQERSK